MRNGHQVITTFIIFTCILWASVALADNFGAGNFGAGNIGAGNIGAGNIGADKFALSKCKSNLKNCNAGDGYPNPDAVGVSGHGPALSYTVNGNGTFTDNNTGFIWEIKTNTSGSVHNVDNLYTWSATSSNPDGTLFTVFLNTLNNSCAGDETKSCTTNTDCIGIGNGKCGFTGQRDWCIPNVKRLQSIVDYSTIGPASSVPGATADNVYWSATTKPDQLDVADIVSFGNGFVTFAFKNSNSFSARAVRPCP